MSAATTSPPPAVAAAIAATDQQERLLELRALIHEVASATGTDPLEETLKWGQPSFLPAKRAGTTIRLGATPTHAAIYVHCQTTLVNGYRERFPTEFAYEGNRAVLIPHEAPLNHDALCQIIAAALTYHRNKKAPA